MRCGVRNSRRLPMRDPDTTRFPPQVPPFDAVFPLFQDCGIRYRLTASAADRAVLVELRRFLAVIHAICTVPRRPIAASAFSIGRNPTALQTVARSVAGFTDHTRLQQRKTRNRLLSQQHREQFSETGVSRPNSRSPLNSANKRPWEPISSASGKMQSSPSHASVKRRSSRPRWTLKVPSCSFWGSEKKRR